MSYVASNTTSNIFYSLKGAEIKRTGRVDNTNSTRHNTGMYGETKHYK